MSDDLDINWPLVGIAGVGILVLAYTLLYGLPYTAAGYESSAENITGPPPMTYLAPLWTVPVAAVIAVVLGFAISLIGVGDKNEK